MMTSTSTQRQPDFASIKPGDLVGHNAVVIGIPTGQVESDGYLGLNHSTSNPGTLCFRSFGGTSGQFIHLNQDHWAQGAARDHRGSSSNPARVGELLDMAATTLRNGGDEVFFGNLANQVNRGKLADKLDELKVVFPKIAA